MATELKIVNLAFRPLSDEGDEEADKEDLGGDQDDKPGGKPEDDEEDADLEMAEE